MAVRIAGVLIPNEKRVEIALTYVFGVGLAKSNDILKEAEVDPNARVNKLSEDEVNKIREITEKKYRVEGDLRRDIASNIKHLKESGSYKGRRHSRGVTVRGQRTKTNSRTVRGNKRRTAGSGKANANQKT